MSASDLAKEAIRIANTAGLSKDVIDLLKEKINLLDDKVKSLTDENNSLKAENYDLKKRIDAVEQTQSTSQPRPEGFDETTEAILDILFEYSNGISMESIAQRLGQKIGIIQYHFDLLFKAKFARQHTAGFNNSGTFVLTSRGRAYIINRNR